MFALTLLWLQLRGSCTNACPFLIPGGMDPVTTYLSDSMMVVLPQPFAPTIMVRGE